MKAPSFLIDALSAGRRLGSNPLAYFAAAYAGAAALQKGVGFLIFLWLAHSLPVEQYATFGLLYALQSFIATFAIAGVVESVIGSLAGSDASKRKRLFGAADLAFVSLSLPSLLVVAVLFAFAGTAFRNAPAAMGCAGVAGVLTAFFTLRAALTRLDERHLASLLLSALPALAGYAGGVIGFLRYQSVTSFYAGSAIGLCVALGVVILRPGDRLHWAGQGEYLRNILRRVGPYALIAALAWLGGYGNTYLVEWNFTSIEVARFTFLYTLSSILQLVATSLNQAWNPRFFRGVHDVPRPEMESRCRRFFTLQGLALGACGAAIILLLPPLVRAIGGNLAAYQHLDLELFLLFAAYVVSIPWWHSQNYFYAFDKGRPLMRVTIVGSAVGLAAWLIAMRVFGPIGVYVGFLMQMFLRMFTAFVWARREWRIRFNWPGVAAGLLLLSAGGALSSYLN